MLKPNRDLRQEIVFLIVFGRDLATVLIGERDVEEELSGDLGLQLDVAVDDVIVEIEHRRLIEEGV